jgi:hypothetical protein
MAEEKDRIHIKSSEDLSILLSLQETKDEYPNWEIEKYGHMELYGKVTFQSDIAAYTATSVRVEMQHGKHGRQKTVTIFSRGSIVGGECFYAKRLLKTATCREETGGSSDEENSLFSNQDGIGYMLSVMGEAEKQEYEREE